MLDLLFEQDVATVVQEFENLRVAFFKNELSADVRMGVGAVPSKFVHLEEKLSLNKIDNLNC